MPSNKITKASALLKLNEDVSSDYSTTTTLSPMATAEVSSSPIAQTSADMDATRLYLKQVSKTPLLGHAQEIEIAKRIENAKKSLLCHLFEIPSAVSDFQTRIQKTINGEEGIESFLMVEDEADKEITLNNLKDIHKDIESYMTGNLQDENLRLKIAESISTLPTNLAFYDAVVEPFLTLATNITFVQGEFLRFAAEKGVSREVFLEDYMNDGSTSSSSSSKWTKFLENNKDGVNSYRKKLAEKGAVTGLSLEVFQEKIKKIRAQVREKDRAVDDMLKGNLRLVVSVAKKYLQVSQTPILDLVQEGNIGLMKAIEKYNWRRGFRFSTYATWWIKQCVLKALNEQHRIIRIPSHMNDLVKKVNRAREEYMGSNGFEPSISEISALIGAEESQVEKVYTVAQGTISLETPIGGSNGDEDGTISQLIVDTDSANAFDIVAEADISDVFSEVLKELTPKEERVIRMRFGIGVQEENTLEDIGLRFGVTRERIRQIEKSALIKLKEKNMATRLLHAFE